MSPEVLTAITGAIASFLSGLLGIGGGLVLAPLLLYGPPLVGAAAFPVKLVAGLTIVQAVSASVLGTLRHRRYGNVSWRLVRTMGPISGAASFAGALLSRDTPDHTLLLIFAVFSLVGAVALLLPVATQESAASDIEFSAPVAAAIAAVIGFFGGMVGIGAIAFLIAALVYGLRIPAHVAIGSSLAIGFFSAVAGLAGKAATSQVDPLLGLIVFASALVASPVGAAVSQRSRPKVLLTLLAGLVGLTAIRMLWQALTGS